MAKNLCYQMTSAIENGFKPGMDKHSSKAQNREADYKIYSYAARKDMIDFAHRFSAFIKTEYPEVRKVKDITIEHVNGYLSTRTNVTQATLKHDVSCLNKLALCVNRKFNLDVDWKTGRSVPKTAVEKRRVVAFTPEQIKELDDYFSAKKDCYSKKAYYLGKRFALRASEIVKLQARDIFWDRDILHIHDSKGKRSRNISINEDDKLFLKELVGNKKDNERLIPLRQNSICSYLNKACKILGYKDIVEAKSSFHALRKASISQFYKEQCGTVGAKKATELSMERLGHGKCRSELFRVYIHV